MEIKDALDEYKLYLTVEKNASFNTIENYMRDLMDFQSFLSSIKITLIEDISREHIHLYMKELDRKLIASSKNRHLTSIKMLFRFLIRNNLISHNPAEHFDSPKKSKLSQTISKDSLRLLIDSIEIIDEKNSRDKTMIYTTRMRVSEICHIKFNDISLSHNTFVIIGRGNKERIVFFDDATKLLLQEYISVYHDNFLRNQTQYLFLLNNGNKMSRG